MYIQLLMSSMCWKVI